MRAHPSRPARQGIITPPALYANTDNPRAADAINYLQRHSAVRVEVRPTSALLPPGTCPTCAGTGAVLHPDWEAYYQAFPTAHDEPEDPATWFQETGRIEHRDELPPQRLTCPDCDGHPLRPRRLTHG